MNRRELLRRSALASAAVAARRLHAQDVAPEVFNPAVRRVLVVAKCHLDVGFSDTQANVIRKYFDVYYPAAIEVGTLGHCPDVARYHTLSYCTGPLSLDQSSRNPNPPYTWTTGSWLLYTYLEQATAAQRKTMEDAIRAGHIAWHALPFSWQTEFLSPSMIAGGLSFSQELDRRFGTRTTGAKMTDVPGHTRGLIAPLAAAGVTLLDIGVNAASTPPVVPDVFRWQDHAGHSITVLYHRHDYGSVLAIPGTDLAVAVEVKNDNGGPHTPEEITAIYARLHKQFPNAGIFPASLSEVANAISAAKPKLPVVTGEIGDTWIYGLPSDPPKVARFLELSRLRDEWISSGKLHAGDVTDRAYLEHLLLCAEHTWGTDTKTYLDYAHYRPAEITTAEAAHLPGYAKMETSWQEKRDNITVAVATLPAPLQGEANHRLVALAPHAPQPRLVSPGSSPHPSTAVPVPQSLTLQNERLSLRLDPMTGSITSLVDRRSGRDWASPTNPLALLTYQTLSAEEYDAFIARYLVVKTWWGPRDFGKPEITQFGAEAAALHAHLAGSTTLYEQMSSGKQEVLSLELSLAPAATAGGSPSSASQADWALPASTTLTLSLRNNSPTLEMTLTLLGKPANRLPEALWFTFNPVTPNPGGWLLIKSGQPVLPSEVLEGGGRAMHAVTGDIFYGDAHGALTLRSLDAPVIALGTRSPLNFSRSLPDLAGGIHVSLFNNAWGTNYPQWASGDWQFRFSVTVA